jgi:hypothetical protein
MGIMTARERSLALEAVLSNAPTLGVQEAVERFGAALTPTERQLISSLSQEELAAFVSTRAKLGGIGFRLPNNNNFIL